MVWQTLRHVPWWTYVLLLYLMGRGVFSPRIKAMPLWEFFLLPLLFILTSFHTLLTGVQVALFSVSVWSASILVGVVIGWWMSYRWKVSVDKSNRLVRVPGMWSGIILVSMLMGTKFYFGYELFIDPGLAEQTAFEVALLAVSGMCAGFFGGRLLGCLYRLQATDELTATQEE